MRTKRSDEDRHAREHEKRLTNRASLLREKAGSSRRTAAASRAVDPNAVLAERKAKAVPAAAAAAKARWAEPRQPGGSRKVLTEKGRFCPLFFCDF